MSEFRNSYFDTHAGIGRIGKVDHATQNTRFRTTQGLRFSSPWPWLLALSISLAMWASLAWLAWWIFAR